MFQFKNLIQTGMASANLVEQNRESINAVFDSLNDALDRETQGQITIERVTMKPSNLVNIIKTYDMAIKGLEPLLSIERKQDNGILQIVLSDGCSASVARWEQHSDGYPFTIEFLGERTDCWDQEALVSMLGKIVSSGQFWLKVKELQSRAQKGSEKNSLHKE